MFERFRNKLFVCHNLWDTCWLLGESKLPLFVWEPVSIVTFIWNQNACVITAQSILSSYTFEKSKNHHILKPKFWLETDIGLYFRILYLQIVGMYCAKFQLIWINCQCFSSKIKVISTFLLLRSQNLIIFWNLNPEWRQIETCSFLCYT